MPNRKNNPIATRARILKSAGEEYCRMGFQAARLNAIVEHSGITKGSLFHHFSGKDDLALQWLKETMPLMLENRWVRPLEESSNPIDSLKEILRQSAQLLEKNNASDSAIDCMSTLAASIQPSDALLHQAMTEIQQVWHRAVSDSLLRGQQEKRVHAAVVANDEAYLIITIALGMELQCKTMGSSAMAGLLRSANAYLETLRPS
jgi:AcrR family transcriptional regulator